MAATFSLLKLKLPNNVAQKPHQYHPPQPKLSVLSNPTKLINPPKHLTIHHIKSASLPLTTLALPFFLDAKVKYNIKLSSFSVFFLSRIYSVFRTKNRMLLLWMESWGSWREEVLHLYTPLWWVVCSFTHCGLATWVGNGGESGPSKMRLMSSRNKSSQLQLPLKGNQWKQLHHLWSSRFSSSLRFSSLQQYFIYLKISYISLFCHWILRGVLVWYNDDFSLKYWS